MLFIDIRNIHQVSKLIYFIQLQELAFELKLAKNLFYQQTLLFYEFYLKQYKIGVFRFKKYTNYYFLIYQLINLKFYLMPSSFCKGQQSWKNHILQLFICSHSFAKQGSLHANDVFWTIERCTICVLTHLVFWQSKFKYSFKNC